MLRDFLKKLHSPETVSERRAFGEQIEEIATELYELSLVGLRLPRHLVISPDSKTSKDFWAKLARLEAELERSGEQPQKIRAVRKDIRDVVERFSRWQNAEVDRLLTSLTDTIQNLVVGLKETAGTHETTIEEFAGLEENLRRAAQAPTLEQVRTVLTEQSGLLQKMVMTQKEVQKNLHREYEASVAALQEQLQSIEAASKTDALTGVANRAAVEAHFLFILDRVASGEEPYSMAIFDLDRFKPINDRYGHVAGDRALQEFARLLKRSFAKTGFVARLGGDEFVVIAKESEAALQRQAQKLQIELSKTDFPIPGQLDAVMTLAASVGVTSISPKDTFEQATNRADELMFIQKKRMNGENQRAA
ncbi:MAG: GGDEF domain-containing protein [Armatimonadetes bacterium]|nr:GGDEF domain-containing protein [Armatimonadota bacterium]